MASDESFFVLVHYRGSIKKKTRLGIKFTDKDPLSRLGLHGVKRVEKLFYRILISVLRDDVKYDSFVISSDEYLQVLFHCRRQFPKVRTSELLAKLVDVVCSSGGSNRNPQSSGHPSCSSSMPVGASSAVLVIVPKAVLVASPSFAANLNRNGDTGVGETGLLGEVAIATPGTPIMVSIFGKGRVLDGVENALHDDDDDDVEPAKTPASK
ncbi:hypothetical protein Ahy_B10g106527 [Arachis hypogaea]|uniref:Uncharacterized protein n=1 Tax=Arachis hypogaea TaxID=3818 RepID=A0A444XBR1_ARAHY|nr:hypothetical protein Ahy_B10g106527 [Arachis hypogaea]